jgi:hypothetical protein
MILEDLGHDELTRSVNSGEHDLTRFDRNQGRGAILTHRRDRQDAQQEHRHD